MMAMKKHDTYRGELKLNEPMSKHTSWRVGGPADRFYTPADEADLAEYVASLPGHEPLFWLGLGSNLLVRDGGIRGTVISLQGSLSEMRVLDGGNSRHTFARTGFASDRDVHQINRIILGDKHHCLNFKSAITRRNTRITHAHTAFKAFERF